MPHEMVVGSLEPTTVSIVYNVAKPLSTTLLEVFMKKCPECNGEHVLESFKEVERSFQSEYIKVSVYIYYCKDCDEPFTDEDQEGEIKRKLGLQYRRLLGGD